MNGLEHSEWSWLRYQEQIFVYFLHGCLSYTTVKSIGWMELRQLTCIRTSDWGEKTCSQLYVPKQFSKFILISHMPQSLVCKIETVTLLCLWRTRGLEAQELCFPAQTHNAWHHGSSALLVNKILTAEMPSGPASHCCSEVWKSSLSRNMLHYLSCHSWSFWRKDENVDMRRKTGGSWEIKRKGIENGGGSGETQWRKNQCVKKKMRGEITAKEAR